MQMKRRLIKSDFVHTLPSFEQLNVIRVDD